MKRLIAVLACLLATACASVVKVESGERTVGERLVVNLEGAWNHVEAPGMGPAQVWTMEGLPVDQLLVYAGLKDGEAIHAQAHGGDDEARRTFVFRASMQPDEIAAIFEGMLTRDGSLFRLARLAPAAFAGANGFRFDFALTRKVDNVRLSGFGYGAVVKGELYAVVYLAPRLVFFSRHQSRVEHIARTARVKG